MGCSSLLILGCVLSVAHCWGFQDMGENPDMEIVHSVTGILGEDVHLSCRYLGEDIIRSAVWKRQSGSRAKTKRLTGFKDDNPFSRDRDFSIPASPTNLTVKMRVSSVEAEGEYTCVFESDEEEITDSMFLTVLARPDTNILVTEEIVNGTHYQSVSCSAANGRPMAQISWLIDDSPPTDDYFTVEWSNTSHPNGTATVSSTLRFPTYLQDEDRVTCEVQHPTLPNPTRTVVRVDTYAAPNVTMEAELVKEEGGEVWEVTCMASGGRPETGISLVVDADVVDYGWQQRKDDMGSETQTSSYRFPSQLYEGHNITCVFDHPIFAHRELRVISLPAFSLSAVKLLHPGFATTNKIQATEWLKLEEGQRNTSIGLEVIGDVPRYTVACTKDDQPLPEGVEVVGSVLTVQGPLEPQHAGLYECEASYHRHKAMIQFTISVEPRFIQPVPPRIRVDLQNGIEDRLIECLAADAVPAASVSWLRPEGVSGVSWFNLTSHNGSHSVRAVLVLPACSPQELTVQCVIDHPLFEKPENRSITLPLCAPPNITINSSTEWRGEEFTVVQCRVDSVGTAATISWHVGHSHGDNHTSHFEEVERQTEVQANGLAMVQSTVRFPSAVYSGQNVTCVTDHQSLNRPERKEIHVPLLKAPVLVVSVVRQQDSPLWLAVCDYRGEGDEADLTWILPENTTGQTFLHSGYEGLTLQAKLTYPFPLALHEGQDLTCVMQNRHGIMERTTHVPQYYISSVRVLNYTTPLRSPHGGEHVINRLALQEKLRGQRILLHVVGHAPTYNLTCQRSDGSLVQMEDAAMVFQSEVTEQDAGLYTCHASFFHHRATVSIQVDVTCEETQLLILVIICISSASAITLFLVVTLSVLCKRNKGNRTMKRESLAALTSLMQHPCSPVLKAAAVPRGYSQEYAQLASYSIVIDVKSTV